ncbi:hypothetical protein Q5692_38470 [Microcoleus sp. C2C3]|uniref:hypothetical protein n=1 Tax=unclassified Microcoleus TaxID=2642155 RepID=UPI002FD05573
MDLFLVAVLSASPHPYSPPSGVVAQNFFPSVVAPTPPYTPPVSGGDPNRPPINTPQTSPTRDPSESWEQKMLRRYGRKVA